MALGQRTVRSSGRPGAKWSRGGKKSHSRVLTWLASRWRNHRLKRAKKPHSKIQLSPQNGRLDGPATRPKRTPLAVENSVGKLAAPEMRRPMSARERELGELPSPICPCSAARLGRDIFCVRKSSSSSSSSSASFSFGISRVS